MKHELYSRRWAAVSLFILQASSKHKTAARSCIARLERMLGKKEVEIALLKIFLGES